MIEIENIKSMNISELLFDVIVLSVTLHVSGWSEIEACRMTLVPFIIEDTSSLATGLHFIGQTTYIIAAYLKDKRESGTLLRFWVA